MDTTLLMPMALLVLVCVGVWTVVELALTIRSTRRVVDNLGTQVGETIAEVTPIVAKLDGVVDSVDPALKQVDPLLQKVGMTVDALTVDLMRVDEVLADVSNVTGSASNATSSVSNAISGVANRAASAVGRITGRGSEDEPDQAKLAAPGIEDIPEPVQDTVYFSYPTNKTAKTSEPEKNDAPKFVFVSDDEDSEVSPDELEDTGVLERVQANPAGDAQNSASAEQHEDEQAEKEEPQAATSSQVSDFKFDFSGNFDEQLAAWLGESDLGADLEATASDNEAKPADETPVADNPEVEPPEPQIDALAGIDLEAANDVLSEWLDITSNNTDPNMPIVIPRGKPQDSSDTQD